MKTGKVKSINEADGIGEILGEDEVMYGFDFDEVKALGLAIEDEVTFEALTVAFANEFVAINVKVQ